MLLKSPVLYHTGTWQPLSPGQSPPDQWFHLLCSILLTSSSFLFKVASRRPRWYSLLSIPGDVGRDSRTADSLLCCTLYSCSHSFILLSALLFYPALDSFIYQTFMECLGTRLDTSDAKLTKAQSCPGGYLQSCGRNRCEQIPTRQLDKWQWEGFYGALGAQMMRQLTLLGQTEKVSQRYLSIF